MSACSIEFFDSEFFWLGFFPSSSCDRIPSYAWTSFGSTCLSSSYALFQIRSGTSDGGDRASEEFRLKMGAAGARGSGGLEEDKVLAGEGAWEVRVAGCYQKYQYYLLL